MGEPLSRVEAILQNILGADNILVPPGSQVEEILQAIYYNTEYEKNPKSRVAEILLAIKNKGVYDGPVLSRVEDILVHKLNNIPYTKHKKEDLSRVEQLLLDWLEQGGGEEIIEYTGTFPMTILANGEPLLDYLISGNTVQSGTPTPDNPVMPQGTGERTGNLVAADVNRTTSIGGLSVVWKKDSSEMTINGKATSGDSYRFATIELDAGTYTLSITGLDETGGSKTGFYFAGVDTVRVQGVRTYTITEPTIARLQFVAQTSDISYENRKVTIMFTKTSTPLPYEPYGYKIPISSANTTTPVYLGQVESTRKIKKLVLTGQETRWYKSGAYQGSFYLSDVSPAPISPTEQAYCSHAEFTSISTYTQNKFCFNGTPLNLNLWIGESSWTTDDFKAYLAQQYAAGTPVTVWYVLATPETGIVNEPLMKIGSYADSISMEQAGEDIPTNKKPTETVIDVPTSVKPSEGYIKYTEPTDGPTPKTQVLGTKNHEIYMTSNDEVYVLRR